MFHRPRARLLVGALLLVSLPLVACGNDNGTSIEASSPNGDFPVDVGGVTIDKRPTRIVSLSASSTEMLYAIGAGANVVAVDVNSNYPHDAPDGDIVTYPSVNVEALVAKDADLIVSDAPIEGSKVLGVPVLVHPAAATIDDTYVQLKELGIATGRTAEAAAVIDDLRDRIEAAIASVDAAGLTYYYELDETLYSVTTASFIGSLLAELGLVNIADAAPGAAGAYPQLSAEYIVSADPDLVLLADTKCCGQSATTVAARPGWAGMTAVTDGGVVELDDDVASRWGPRVVELLETVANAATAFAG